MSDHLLTALRVEGSVPCESAIRWTLQRLDGDELDVVIGGWAAGCAQPTPSRARLIAVDGQRVRGSGGRDVDPRHLLGAIDHTHGVVLAQWEVDGKTNEILEFAPLLDSVALAGAMVTADAMHAQRAHADYLVLERGTHYLLTVKGNQPGLYAQLKALPWADVPVARTHTGRTHGRVEKRSVKAVKVDPGSYSRTPRQAIQVTRRTRRLDGATWSTEIAYAVTDLPAEQAQPADLASWIRGHWCVENRLHWVRDVTYDEDRSQIRTGNGPRAMSSLGNLVLSMLRLHGATNIAQALRHFAWDPRQPVALLLRC